MDCYTRKQIENAVIAKGYKYFSTGDLNLNIIGIRNSETAGKVTNAFDDCISLSYKLNNEWKFHCFKCTTDPGTHWVENLLNPKGVAILKPGQYRSSHKIDLHQGKYEALRQQKPLEVYRDGNKDGIYDCLEEDVEKGIFGINIHRATAKEHGKSTRIDKWSAGCQVISSSDDFAVFMKICRQARDVWSNNFTYTLIESEDCI
jgi:hypothetical protein|tara:strand:- start:1202 stop:1810 length:609 start_codon:yes stop_codon:yes gene_type:complete